MLEGIRTASRVSIQSQSVYTRLCVQQAQNQQALASAQTATGALQIGQAQAQIQALTNEQLASIEQITAANGRVEAAYRMMQVQQAEQGRINADHWLEGYGAQGFKGPHQGQGITLP